MLPPSFEAAKALNPRPGNLGFAPILSRSTKRLLQDKTKLLITAIATLITPAGNPVRSSQIGKWRRRISSGPQFLQRAPVQYIGSRQCKRLHFAILLLHQGGQLFDNAVLIGYITWHSDCSFKGTA